MRLLWNTVLTALILGAALSLLLHWLGRCGLPLARNGRRSPAAAGVEIPWGEGAQVFCLALGFRLLVFLAAAIFTVQVLHREDIITVWKQWDAWHYVGLAEQGYAGYTEGGKPYFVVFFPLYVWLTRLAALLTGHTPAAGLLISWLCYGWGCVYLYKLAAWEYGRAAARRAVLFLSVFPYSFFFGGIMTEGLFLLTTAAALYAVRRHRYAAAGVWGFLAAMTRMNGLLLIVAAGAELLEETRLFARRGKDLRRCLGAILRKLPLVLLPLAGTAVYLELNRRVTGDPFGFAAMQRERWSQGFHWVSDTLFYVLEHAVHYGNNMVRHQLWIPTLLLFPIFFGLLLAARGRHRSMLVLYGFAYLIANYSLSWLLSAGRYVSCGVPFFLLAAGMTETRPLTARVLTVGMAALFAVHVAIYLAGGQIM